MHFREGDPGVKERINIWKRETFTPQSKCAFWVWLNFLGCYVSVRFMSCLCQSPWKAAWLISSLLCSLSLFSIHKIYFAAKIYLSCWLFSQRFLCSPEWFVFESSVGNLIISESWNCWDCFLKYDWFNLVSVIFFHWYQNNTFLHKGIQLKARRGDVEHLHCIITWQTCICLKKSPQI